LAIDLPSYPTFLSISSFTAFSSLSAFRFSCSSDFIFVQRPIFRIKASQTCVNFFLSSGRESGKIIKQFIDSRINAVHPLAKLNAVLVVNQLDNLIDKFIPCFGIVF